MGKLSRWINRAFGGTPGETLCRRVGFAFGPYCLFCRVVGWFLSDEAHCSKEMADGP